MRELRIQHAGRPYRVLYAFDPRRAAILLLGGDKTGARSLVRSACAGGRYAVRRAPRDIEAGGIAVKRYAWADIKARVKPATRARIESEARRLSEHLHLSQLRKAKGLTQEAMAELLGVSQAEVSKMERRSELYIGTLKKFIEAMDGKLVLAARFPDGVEVPIRLAEADDAA
jgi:DNA-binding transcriptional regulator YiaG